MLRLIELLGVGELVVVLVGGIRVWLVSMLWLLLVLLSKEGLLSGVELCGKLVDRLGWSDSGLMGPIRRALRGLISVKCFRKLRNLLSRVKSESSIGGL